MKKLICACMLIALISTAAFAMPSGTLPYGVSARYAAMGGAGASLVDDIASAYYNPAGMARGQAIALKLGGGFASQGSDQLLAVLSSVSNPAKFLADNYSKEYNLRGNLDLFLGLSSKNFGISATPVTHLYLNKAANTVSGNVTAVVNSDSALTFGYGIGVPYLADLNIGFNAKYIHNATADASATATSASTTEITNTYDYYSGFGMDVGIQGKTTAIPMWPVYFGVVYKDLFANLTGKRQVTKANYDNSTGSQVGSTTTVSDTSLPASPVPNTLVLSAATEIPVVGLKAAVDLDSVSSGYSVTHIGLEYPVAMGLVDLRLGSVSGGSSSNPINMVTYGIGIMDTVNIALVSDNNRPSNNQTTFDVHIGF